LDCFCGSGTTLKSAQMLNRQWIGIDQSELAIQITKEKIGKVQKNLFIPKREYEFITLNKSHYTVSSIKTTLVSNY